jgi:hypothetical protein
VNPIDYILENGDDDAADVYSRVFDSYEEALKEYNAIL